MSFLVAYPVYELSRFSLVHSTPNLSVSLFCSCSGCSNGWIRNALPSMILHFWGRCWHLHLCWWLESYATNFLDAEWLKCRFVIVRDESGCCEKWTGDLFSHEDPSLIPVPAQWISDFAIDSSYKEPRKWRKIWCKRRVTVLTEPRRAYATSVYMCVYSTRFDKPFLA